MRSHGRIQVYGLGDLLDTSIRLYRGAFVSFVLTAAAVVVPLTLLAIAAIAISSALQGDAATTDPAAVDGLNPVLTLASTSLFGGRRANPLEQLVAFFVTPLMQGALIYGASRRVFDATFSAGSAYRSAFRRAWLLIGVQLILVLLIAIPLVPIVCLGIGVGTMLISSALDGTSGGGQFGGTSSVFAVVGLTLVLIVPVLLFVLTRLALTGQAVMLEEKGPWASVKRSWELTARSFWRVLGYVFVIGLLGSVIGLVIPLTLTFPLLLLFPNLPWLTNSVNALANALSSVLVTPFSVIAYTLLYYDLRVRSEGIEGMSADLGSALLGPIEAPGADT